MTGLPSISASDLAAVSALVDELPSGEATALDLSDPTHRAAIQAALAAAGRSPDRYPALHARLDASGTAHADGTLTLIDQGRDRSGRATAMTWYAAGPKTLYVGGSLFALDGDSGDLLAVGYNSNVGDGFVPVSTDTPTARLAGKTLKVLAVSHSVSEAGEASFTALASITSVWASRAADIEVAQPTQSPTTPPNVVIALGRNSVGIDADYVYLEPQNLDTPYLIVPFVGEASLAYTIKGTPGMPIAGANLTTMIYFVSGGVTQTVPLNTTYTGNFLTAVTINQDNPTMMEWSYPYDEQSYDDTLSLVYNAQSLVNEQIAYFFYSFEIPIVDGPTPTYTFAVCSENTPNEPTYQCFLIPNIMFWWHCLAAGTRVRLADGSEAPIEAVDNTHRVKTGMPGAADLAVEATSKGLHKAAKGDAGHSAVYRLVTDQGHELVGTGQHVVKTPGGFVALGDLRPGDEVTAETAIVRVASCESIDWDGGLYNLKLGNGDDRAAGLPADAVCTYVANGLVVGDHQAMKAEQRRLARNLEYMSTRLPVGLAADYASAVEDIRY
jgi:hypothetical protein